MNNERSTDPSEQVRELASSAYTTRSELLFLLAQGVASWNEWRALTVYPELLPSRQKNMYNWTE